MPNFVHRQLSDWCGQYQAKPAEPIPVAPVEQPIVLKAGDVWEGILAASVLVEAPGKGWLLCGNNFVRENRWFGLWFPDGSTLPMSAEKMREYLKGSHRIGHIETTLIKD